MHHHIHDARDIWGINSVAEMLQTRQASLQRRGLSIVLLPDGTPARHETLTFYVSDGRWVATCPACNGGVAHYPDTPWTVCPDCGKGYNVHFPAQKERIEKRLMERPPHNRQLPRGWSLDELEEDIRRFGLSHHSWTAPRTWVSSELVTAAIGNTHWRDNQLETGPAKVTQAGDTLYAGAANSLSRLAIGATGKVLMASGNPIWDYLGAQLTVSPTEYPIGHRMGTGRGSGLKVEMQTAAISVPTDTPGTYTASALWANAFGSGVVSGMFSWWTNDGSTKFLAKGFVVDYTGLKVSFRVTDGAFAPEVISAMFWGVGSI